MAPRGLFVQWFHLYEIDRPLVRSIVGAVAAVFPDYANLLGPSTALFQPGVLNGVADPVMRRGKVASKSDLANPAPNIGFAWTPNVEHGFLGRLIGHDNKSVIRGGFARNYYDEGTNFFSSIPGSNPGQLQSLDLRPGVAPGFSPGGLTKTGSLRTKTLIDTPSCGGGSVFGGGVTGTGAGATWTACVCEL